MISVDKQVDILFWYQEGKSQRWIARKLRVSRMTVLAVICRGRVKTEGNGYLPTPEEISREKVRIRAGRQGQK